MSVLNRKALDELARAEGFEDDVECISVIHGLDSGRPGMVFAYEVWKQNDGSKAGAPEADRATKEEALTALECPRMADPGMPPHAGPAQDFERFLENSSETEINQWAVRTFGDDHKVVVWLIRELRRLRARVEELEARKGR